MTEVLLCEQRDRIAVLTLNDPPKRNAFSKAMREALIATLQRLNADDWQQLQRVRPAPSPAYNGGRGSGGRVPISSCVVSTLPVPRAWVIGSVDGRSESERSGV